MRSRPLVPVALSALLLLAGCTFSVGVDSAPTVPPEDLATLAADELEKETGLRPVIDCGEEPIRVKEDTAVTCLLVDPVAGLEFDTVITFTEVEGRDYTISVRVADAPNNAPQPTAEPGASVPIEDIEALAIRALAPGLGYVPEVACAGGDVDIVVGNTVECEFASPDGAVPAIVTITAFDAVAGTYSIRVDY